MVSLFIAFYCSTLGLNMKSLQMHWKILTRAINVRIDYLSKYSKYGEGLLINMPHFYIHHGLPCEAIWHGGPSGISVAEKQKCLKHYSCRGGV